MCCRCRFACVPHVGAQAMLGLVWTSLTFRYHAYCIVGTGLICLRAPKAALHMLLIDRYTAATHDQPQETLQKRYVTKSARPSSFSTDCAIVKVLTAYACRLTLLAAQALLSQGHWRCWSAC